MMHHLLQALRLGENVVTLFLYVLRCNDDVLNAASSQEQPVHCEDSQDVDSRQN
jgi:hypothetical protein